MFYCSLILSSCGRNRASSNQCVKLHDEVLDCFKHIDTSQQETWGTAYGACTQQYTQTIETIKPKVQGQLTQSETQRLSNELSDFMDTLNQCVQNAINSSNPTQTFQGCSGSIQSATRSLISKSKNILCKHY